VKKISKGDWLDVNLFQNSQDILRDDEGVDSQVVETFSKPVKFLLVMDDNGDTFVATGGLIHINLLDFMFSTELGEEKTKSMPIVWGSYSYTQDFNNSNIVGMHTTLQMKTLLSEDRVDELSLEDIRITKDLIKTIASFEKPLGEEREIDWKIKDRKNNISFYKVKKNGDITVMANDFICKHWSTMIKNYHEFAESIASVDYKKPLKEKDLALV
jgi:hypothetical protein